MENKEPINVTDYFHKSHVTNIIYKNYLEDYVFYNLLLHEIVIVI